MKPNIPQQNKKNASPCLLKWADVKSINYAFSSTLIMQSHK